MKTLAILAISLSFICFSSCSKDNSFRSEPEICESALSESEEQLQSEADSLYLPVSVVKKLTHKAKQERKYSIVMAEHTFIKDQNYYIDISESEANSLGVPSYYYHETINHLKIINAQINQSIKKGARISLVDMQETVAELKTNKINKITSPSTSRGTFDPQNHIAYLYSSNGDIDSVEVIHRSNESFTGTAICSIIGELCDPKLLPATIYVEAISSNFKDMEHKEINNKSANYYFHLKVKPFGLTPKYTIKFISYPYPCWVEWYNFIITNPNQNNP